MATNSQREEFSVGLGHRQLGTLVLGVMCPKNALGGSLTIKVTSTLWPAISVDQNQGKQAIRSHKVDSIS